MKMREIKFRGYDLDNKEWKYGAYIKHIDATPCLFTSKEEKEKWYKEHTKYLIAFDGFSDWWMPRGIDVCTSIAADSIGQFTGLFDKNKKEIYEGDIIKINPLIVNGKFMDTRIGKVVFKEGAFWLDFNNDGSFLYDDIFEHEVIGNIYENSELLPKSLR